MELTTNHLRYMNIGLKYWGTTRNSLTASQKSLVGNYIAKLDLAIRGGVGLFLWGPNGTGKSYIAALLCKLIRGGHELSSYFVTAAELKTAWISDLPAHDGSEEFMSDRVQTAKFLVIDDLGREYRTASGFSETNFDTLLRNRVRKKYMTVITTNLSPNKFRDVYGVGASQLISESTLEVALTGKNMRELEAEKINKMFR